MPLLFPYLRQENISLLDEKARLEDFKSHITLDEKQNVTRIDISFPDKHAVKDSDLTPDKFQSLVLQNPQHFNPNQELKIHLKRPTDTGLIQLFTLLTKMTFKIF